MDAQKKILCDFDTYLRNNSRNNYEIVNKINTYDIVEEYAIERLILIDQKKELKRIYLMLDTYVLLVGINCY